MEATKLMDLLKFKSYWRFLKKGITAGILTGVATWLIALGMSAFNGGIPIKLESMAQFSVLSGGILVALTVGWIVYGIVAGFIIEFINNNNSKIIRWINK
mgnify:FL=1